MWEEILKQIEHLKALDHNFTVHGSEYHRYSFNPPVSLATMAEVEDDLGVPLPEELKTFYLEVGNGGAGPDSGLHKIEDIEGYKANQNWPGCEAVDAIEEDGDEDTDNRVSGLVAIMDRYYSHESCIVMNGEDVGQIIAFEPWGFIFFEAENLRSVYERWLKKEIGWFNFIKGLIATGDDIVDLVQQMDDLKKAHRANALRDIASLLNFGFSYNPDGLNAFSNVETTAGKYQSVMKEEIRRMFNEKLDTYRSEVLPGAV
jgi:hypothetical protein